jgi:hypothetical protein
MNQETVTLLLDPVVRWLRDGGDPWEANLEYWSVRRRLMDSGHSFEGIGAETVSNVDTAMDVFSPDDDRHSGQIDEGELRVELTQAINALREIGLLPET